MTNLPRMDEDVQYRIPYGLYRKVMKFLGYKPVPFCASCQEKGAWIFGDNVKSCLDALHEISTPEADILASYLYDALMPDPEPPELQEV